MKQQLPTHTKSGDIVNAAESATKLKPATEPDMLQYLLTVACRFQQGLVAFTIMLAASRMESAFAPPLLWAYFGAAAVLCGVGLSVAADSFLVAQLGQRAGCLATAMFSILGLALALVGETPEYLLSASVLIGLGVGTDWSSVSEVARRSLSTTVRWQGMKIWSTAFAAGVACAVLIRGDLQTAFYVANGIGVIIFGVLLCTRPSISLPEMVKQSAPSATIQDTLATSSQATPAENPVATSALTMEADCDATECCGGTREFRPTSFRHGVLLASVGILALWGPIGRLAVEAVNTPGWSRMGVAFGLPAGFLLMFSVAPRTGYAVAVLPFLVLSALSLPFIGLLPAGSRWLMAAMGCGAVFSATVVCGISSLMGELFSDCPTDALRSRVLCVAVFASSALISLLAGLQLLLLQSEYIIVMLESGIFIVGVLTVRRLPNPVISSLGRDEPADANDEELNDVIAAINN